MSTALISVALRRIPECFGQEPGGQFDVSAVVTEALDDEWSDALAVAQEEPAGAVDVA